MAKQGKIEWPAQIANEDHSRFHYVGNKTQAEFSYHGNTYKVRFVDGCFCPFVFKA